MKYAILTDSTSNIPHGTIIDGVKIYTSPIYIYVNDKEYKENVTITIDDISKELNESTKFRTSQPSTLDFIELHKEMFNDGVTHCIAVHASTGLTGTYQNSVLASKMNDYNLEFLLVDSKHGSYPLEKMVYMVKDYLLENQETKSWEKIKEETNQLLEKEIKETKLFIIPSNLKQLSKSGRANMVELLAATVLNIKVILSFNEEGKLQIADKVRTEKKVKKFILDEVKKANELGKTEFAFLYIDDKTLCIECLKEAEILYPHMNFLFKRMIPVVAVYTGNGTIAISY